MFGCTPFQTAFMGSTLKLAAILLLAGTFLWAGAARADEAAPTTRPDESPEARRLEKNRQLLLDYLTRKYSEKLESKDWITRSVAVISLSRLPTEQVTAVLVNRLEAEPHNVGKLVVWQAVLARAGMLDPEQFKLWQEQTWAMVDKDLFHGDLRIGLLEMLSSAPLTGQGRAWFSRLFARTSSLDSADIPTLIAMGQAVRSWGSEDLVAALIRQLRSSDDAVRAELVLQAAGADVPWDLTSKAFDVYTDWWQKSKESFTANPPGEADYRKLRPQFLAAPVPREQVDPRSDKWRKDLELGDLGLRMFDFGISIDCSGSMAGELERLKRDMWVMFEAFAQVSHEPRVSLTLFAPAGMVEHLPLTGSRRRLMSAVGKVQVLVAPSGKVDEEWAGSLAKAITGSDWSPAGERNKRVIVLISDEPIVPEQAKRCLEIAKEAGQHGFRIYGVKVLSAGGGRRNPLSVPFDRAATAPDYKSPGGKGWEVYDQIAELTDARAITVRVPQGEFGLGGAIDPKSKLSPVRIAPIYRGGGPTSMILNMVLTDAINPQYADRVEPLVKILVAYCQSKAERPSEKRQRGKPDKMEPNEKS